MDKVITLVMISLMAVVSSQRYDFYQEKPGSCSPPLPLQVCSRACIVDAHCPSIRKCCPTSCGGTTCSIPVTMRTSKMIDKPGSCPTNPTGRWVCSPTCSVDSDCRGTKKCCENRCGALACQKPDVEIVKAVEIPFETSSDVTSPNTNDIPTDIINRYTNNPFFGDN